MSTYEDRRADAREEARVMMHGEEPECPERPCHDYPLCRHKPSPECICLPGDLCRGVPGETDECAACLSLDVEEACVIEFEPEATDAQG